MRSLSLMALFVIIGMATAAPIPKSLKTRKVAGDPNGVWELIRFNSNGTEGKHQGMSRLWEIDGESIYIGIPTPDDRGRTSGNDFKITNPDDPDFRMYLGSYSSRLKVSGDELSWVYTSNKNIRLDECEPGPNRYYYEFKRVK